MSEPIQRKYQFTINIVMRPITTNYYPTVEDVRSYIEDAVSSWGGGFHTNDEMHPQNIHSISVANLKGPNVPKNKKKKSNNVKNPHVRNKT